MDRRRFGAFVAGSAASFVPSLGTAATELQPFGNVPGVWRLDPALSDDFKGRKIDRSIWEERPSSWGTWSWEDDNVALTQDAGHQVLGITMRHAPHFRARTQLYFTSGILRSRKRMAYGYFEARLKACRRLPGACPSFWSATQGIKPTGPDRVTFSEVDFVELLQRGTNPGHIDCNLHLRRIDDSGQEVWMRPRNYPDLCKGEWQAPWDPRDDYHVYGCMVDREWIRWFIDGEPVVEKRNLYWHLPRAVILSMGLRPPFEKNTEMAGRSAIPTPDAPADFPTTMYVDYVRCWSVY